MRAVIEALPVGADSPLARLDGLHFSRLQIFRELVHQGEKQRKRDRLRSSHLVFTSTFDGELDPYLDAICARLGADADAWWEHCAGYPGTADRAAFKRYIRDHQTDTSLFASAHPNASVARVRESVELRERIVDFAADAQGLDAAELQATLPGAVRALMRLGRPPNLPRRRSSTARVDLSDIQGNVLRGYSHPTRGVPVPADRRRRPGARADDAGCCHRWRRPSRGPTGLRTPRCTSPSPTAGPVGARRCRPTCSTRSRHEFREGMAARAERLGDRGPSAPEHWEAGLGTGEAHVLVTVYARRRRAARRARARRCAAWVPAGAVTVVHEQRAAALRRRARPLRLRRRDRAAGCAGQRRGAAAGRRPAGRCRPLARGPDRRVPARLRGRGRPAARGAGGAARPQRHVHGLPQAGRWTWRRSAASSPSRASATPAARSCWRPRSSAAGATARRSRCRPTGRTPAIAADPARINDFSLPRRRARGCAARSARTSAAPTRATRSASSTGGSPTATASSAAAAPTARRCPRACSRTTASTAGSSSSASTPASGASSRPSRRSGSMTATRSASAATRTS